MYSYKTKKLNSQYTKFQINFFEVSQPKNIEQSVFRMYLKWLYTSTLDIDLKESLIKKTKTVSEIIYAIEVLKENYDAIDISKRNQELLNYHLSRIQPP